MKKLLIISGLFLVFSGSALASSFSDVPENHLNLQAIEYLKRILSMEEYLPLRKYNRKIGHKKGEAKGFTKVGKYPLRCVGAFIELLENVKANADYKGLDSDNLIITHMFASQGFARRSNQAQGRISGKARKRKSAHIEIVVREAR